MNALHRTEIRTYRDMQAQADLERMLANRRAAERARADKFRKPPTQPEPANFCAPDDATPEPFGWIDSAVFLTPMFVVAVLILIARLSGWLA